MTNRVVQYRGGNEQAITGVEVVGEEWAMFIEEEEGVMEDEGTIRKRSQRVKIENNNQCVRHSSTNSVDIVKLSTFIRV